MVNYGELRVSVKIVSVSVQMFSRRDGGHWWVCMRCFCGFSAVCWVISRSGDYSPDQEIELKGILP